MFPQPLTYNRLTGAFEEANVTRSPQNSGSSRGNNNDGLPYGPTDEERERLLEWARTERLPLFLRYEYCVIQYFYYCAFLTSLVLTF